MHTLTGRVLVMFAVSLLAFASRAEAADPTQTDFDACNREAQTRVASPSAAPATERDPATKPGTPVSPSAAPATKSPNPPPTAGGEVATKPGTPVSPSAAPSRDAPKTPPPAPTTGTTDGASKASTASDQLSRGMAPVGQADPAFKQVYVDCMKRRGF
jgi:hypothetical protein